MDTFTATCDTDGCDNAGQAIEMGWDGTPLGAVVCGVCGQAITDLDPDPTAPDTGEAEAAPR